MDLNVMIIRWNHLSENWISDLINFRVGSVATTLLTLIYIYSKRSIYTLLTFNLLLVLSNTFNIEYDIYSQKAMIELYSMDLLLRLSAQSCFCRWAIEYNDRWSLTLLLFTRWSIILSWSHPQYPIIPFPHCSIPFSFCTPSHALACTSLYCFFSHFIVSSTHCFPMYLVSSNCHLKTLVSTSYV